MVIIFAIPVGVDADSKARLDNRKVTITKERALAMGYSVAGDLNVRQGFCREHVLVSIQSRECHLQRAFCRHVRECKDIVLR